MVKLIIASLVVSALLTVSIAQSLDGRIYHGHRTTIFEFPHMVALMNDGRLLCGATIIAPKVVLTAAHCVDGFDPLYLQIKYGVTNYELETGTTIQVVEFFTHPQFERANFQNDIAVLILTRSIMYSPIAQPAELPDMWEEVEDNTIGFVTGWGLTETETYDENLRVAKVNIFGPDDCLNRFGPLRYTDKNLCAGHDETLADACGGDSGGPLVTTDRKLVGIISWGYGCGLKEYPGMYTKVAAYRDWIDSKM